VNFKQTFYQQNVPDGTSEKEKTRLKNFNAFALSIGFNHSLG
jgi:hypothetical protein